MEPVNKGLLSEVENIKEGLSSFSTGGDWDNEEYKRIRTILLKESSLIDKIPKFLLKYRNLTDFWQFIKLEFGHYAERRKFLSDEFSALFSYLEFNQLNNQVLSHQGFEVLKFASSQEIQDSWVKLLDRAKKDPQGAITTARALVEDVCKYILDQYREEYSSKDDISELYKKVTKKLKLAPENHKEDVYKQILGGCYSVVIGLASLRNALGDSHGKGKLAPKPTRRHAQLAVNLAATMSLFLFETYQNKENL